MGLPKGGSVGFELMDNQKFGISQFAEQINYQRALEGELQRTIESINAVRGARASRDPEAVGVRARQGSAERVGVHRPLPGPRARRGWPYHHADGVVRRARHAREERDDRRRDGNLLTQTASASGLDASQLKYVQQVEHNTQKRIDAILAPIFGAGNARSQVSADLDFSKLEQTSESYGPNGNPQQSAIRSQQTSSSTELAQGGASGVPGALSNTPPQPASAPIVAGNGANAPQTTPVSDRKDQTTNYEVDKTIRHLEQPMGSVKRLSVAVVVNTAGRRREGPRDDAAAAAREARAGRTAREGCDGLRREARRLGERREQRVLDRERPVRRPAVVAPADMIAMAKEAAKWLGIAAAAAVLYFMFVRPAMRRAFPPPEPAAPALAAPEDPVALDACRRRRRPRNPIRCCSGSRAKNRYERNLDYARTIARQDPKIVATVVKNWVSDER